MPVFAFCFCFVLFFPQTGLLSQSYRHQGEGRGEGFLDKVFVELLSLKDPALYTLLISYHEDMKLRNQILRRELIFILSPMMNNNYKNIICVYGS